MGNTGSYTVKANINHNLLVFTTWNNSEMNEFLHRGQQELSEVFGLRKFEFEFLLGTEMIDFKASRALFAEVFDTDKNGVVDKFEVMCVICLISKLSNQLKIHFFFDLFNFNDKGYLYESEVTLLLLAITRGAFKVDQKYIPPSTKIINSLVAEAMSCAKVDIKSVRKPELVEFVLGNKDVLAFLETWRGHSSQVLLGRNNKWRDLTFPCNETSIAPSRDWLYFGLPPGSFIKWRRRDKVGTSGMGCIYLFTHIVGFLKTVDRRIVYEGEGAIGRGSLQQGMLADRWFLNALAAMIARPDTITACFAHTDQENEGRYCVRFYEGTGWRSVYIDDRLPCSPDTNPLFSCSSHGLECWPLILEKGLAKYLSSYGQLAKCSLRSDATMSALRYLTGGHVMRFYTKYFEWSSVEEEIEGQAPNATVLIKAWLNEGTLVSLGRSESLALMNRKTTAKTNQSNLLAVPPYGRLFPILGTVYIKGFQYFILRDAWGLIGDADIGVNYETGHSNTFQVKVEDTAYLYDTMIIVKYPDSLRAEAEEKKLSPWTTSLVSNVTSSEKEPARFVINIPHKIITKSEKEREKQGSDSEEDEVKPHRHGFKKLSVNEVLNEIDAARDGVSTDKPIQVRLKERPDFGRKKNSAAVKLDSVTAEIKAQREKAAKENFPARLKAIHDQMVDVSFTISSSLDWSVGGSKEVGAKMRVRLTPSQETYKALIEREKLLIDIKQQVAAAFEAKRKAQEKLIEIATTEENASITSANDGTSTISGGNKSRLSTAGTATVASSTHAEVDLLAGTANSGMAAGAKRSTVTSNTSDQNGTAGARTSMSGADRRGSLRRKSVNGLNVPSAPPPVVTTKDIPPVTYATAKAPLKPEVILKVPKEDKDLPEGVDRVEAYKLKLDKYVKQFDVTLTGEHTWMSHSMLIYPGEYYLFADVTYAVPYEDAFKLTVPNDISEAPWLQSSNIERETKNPLGSAHGSSMFHMHTNNVHKNHSNSNSRGNLHTGNTNASSAHSISMASGTVKDFNQRDTGVDPMLYNTHKIHVQMSSADKVYVKAVERNYFPDTYNTSLDYLQIEEEKWPFMTETQSEVSSRELNRMLTQLRTEAEVVGLEFMSLTNKFKESRKETIVRHTQMKRATMAATSPKSPTTGTGVVNNIASEMTGANTMEDSEIKY